MKKSVIIMTTMFSLFSISLPVFAAEETQAANYDILLEQETGAESDSADEISENEPLETWTDAAVDENDPAQTSTLPATQDELYDQGIISLETADAIDPNISINDYYVGDGQIDSGTVNCIREAGTGTVEEIYDYWESNGYPSYVSYAFKAGGERNNDVIYTYWEIGIVNATEEQKQEVLNLASPTCLVEFQTCQFTHEQKINAYNQLLALEDKNIQQIIFGKNTDTVIVAVSEELQKEYASRFVQEYGAVVFVIDSNSVLTDENMETQIASGKDAVTNNADAAANLSINKNSISSKTSNINVDISAATISKNVLWLSWIPVLFFFILVFYFVKHSFVVAMQTKNGKIITKSAQISRKQVIEEIKKAEAEPPRELFSSIQETITTEKNR